MKKYQAIIAFCISIIYLGCNTSTGPGSDPQLSQLSTVPASKKISFINETCGWAVCMDSKVLKTVDGGNIWQTVKTPTSEKVQDVQFADRSNGWLSTYNSVYKTSDAGNTWELILKNEETHSFIAMNLVNKDLGFVSGTRDAKVYRTNDGGKTWSLVDLKAVGKISSIHFTNENSGWAAEAAGRIFTTNDKGSTWKVTSSVRFANCVYAISDRTCYAGNNMAPSSKADDKATIYRTDDGGESWVDLKFPESMIIEKIIFNTSSRGCALSDIGAYNNYTDNTVAGASKLIYTDDAGKTWKKVNTSDVPIKDICYAGKKLMVLLWNDKLYELKD